MEEKLRTIGIYGLLGGVVVWSGVLILWLIGTLAVQAAPSILG